MSKRTNAFHYYLRALLLLSRLLLIYLTIASPSPSDPILSSSTPEVQARNSSAIAEKFIPRSPNRLLRRADTAKGMEKDGHWDYETFEAYVPELFFVDTDDWDKLHDKSKKLFYPRKYRKEAPKDGSGDKSGSWHILWEGDIKNRKEDVAEAEWDDALWGVYIKCEGSNSSPGANATLVSRRPEVSETERYPGC